MRWRLWLEPVRHSREISRSALTMCQVVGLSYPAGVGLVHMWKNWRMTRSCTSKSKIPTRSRASPRLVKACWSKNSVAMLVDWVWSFFLTDNSPPSRVIMSLSRLVDWSSWSRLMQLEGAKYLTTPSRSMAAALSTRAKAGSSSPSIRMPLSLVTCVLRRSSLSPVGTGRVAAWSSSLRMRINVLQTVRQAFKG